MNISPRHPVSEPVGFVLDQVGPSFRDLRPGKPAVTSTFPAYPDLIELLTKEGLDHPHPAIGQVLATGAGYAYSDAGTVAMMMTRMGLENNRCRQVTRTVDAMLINSTAHIVQSHDGRAVLIMFRGTPPLDLISWFLDADLYPEKIAAVASGSDGAATPYDVHAGFYRNVRITRHEIIHSLRRACRGESILGDPTDASLLRATQGQDPAQTSATDNGLEPMEALYITGHSLGGAMATLFASMLLNSDTPDYESIASKLKAVYTFGQPMVGGPGFAQAASQQFGAGIPLVRYVYKKDPVPLLPPRSVGAFEHVGQEYRLDTNRTWTAHESSTAMPWVAGLVTSVVSFGLTKFPPLRDVPFRYKIEDHFPHHYVSALIPPGHTDEYGDYYPAPLSDD